jgi:predicted AlkP superfamily pyrophosphatase or phosphodiesterase
MKILSVIFLWATIGIAKAQTPVSPAPPAAPRLIVGIVVDQMRYDFLYRFQDSYGPGGFKRLLREGFSCENTHYNYIPTYTGPGHASIYTGTYPAVHGVIANEWWDPQWGRSRYVTTDTAVRSIGGTGTAGQHSPRVLMSTTITDELRLSNGFKSRVAGVALKDRSSILPAGHFPNGCYWFDDKAGNWISSSYYRDSIKLPDWVLAFNARRLPDQYLSKPWAKLPGVTYSGSFPGWKPFEDAHYADFPGDLPYDLPALKKKSGYGILRFTPFGNSLTVDFGLEAIERMGLGLDAAPDFLCLSFSSTDYVGHQFGLHAEETEDTYLRLDADLARFLDSLDRKFGRENVLVFLTSDHGAAETPAHLRSLKVPAGVFAESRLDSVLESHLAARFGGGKNLVLGAMNQQIWFNQAALANGNIRLEDAVAAAAAFLRTLPGVYDVYTREEARHLPDAYPFAAELVRGLHPRRSGDLLFLLDPGWHPDDNLFALGGTTHGTGYAYDTHVPLLWYGWRIRPGQTHAPVSITDIAPTLAALLKIMEPSGTTGKVIEEILRY